MLASYVLADLLRNPRRTLATMVGVTLGVGLFCGVLFFIDGLSASMTQRAVAPLSIDMQRIVTVRAGNALTLTQTFATSDALETGQQTDVMLEIHNAGAFSANEVTIRSQPGQGADFVVGSARVDGAQVNGFGDNPFAHGAGQAGLNLGSIGPGDTRLVRYRIEAVGPTEIGDTTVTSAYSSRESVHPIPANQPPSLSLAKLAGAISHVQGVADADQLSIADLGLATLSAGSSTAAGPAKIFGFDQSYVERDAGIDIVDGALTDRGAVLSAEAADGLGIGIGDTVTVTLPDATTVDLPITGIADLSRSRALFSSRRGGDLETFIYTRHSIIVSPAVFAETIYPAYERAAANGSGRLKSPPIREIDISVERALLDADPATAVVQTKRIAAEIDAVAASQDYLLDNISNTLGVAAVDAAVAKRLFVFLGVPGGLLAAMLAAYAGNVLADAQRREQATLRIRGASRRHLLRILALRTALLTGAGATVGLAIGYLAAAAVLGRASLDRAAPSSLLTSGVVGTTGGLLATGTALYITGRRSVDREINEDRAQLSQRAPLWRRTRLDVIGVGLVVAATALALRLHAFDGSAGSVYYGRSVELNLALLVLPITVWLTGSLLAARVIGRGLARSRPRSTSSIGSVLPSLFRRSVGRRPWAIGNGAIVSSLIIALATSLAALTASYDAAKVDDARYANGADIRITPSPTAEHIYSVADAHRFETSGITRSTPVIFGLSNVILRSDRTSDPVNLAALDPASFTAVAPISAAMARSLAILETDPNAILVSTDMATFLKAEPGDVVHALLARATDEQIEIPLRIAGLYDRLPGFPEGADAVMSIHEHRAQVPSKVPDFFLAATSDDSDSALLAAVTALERGPAEADDLRIDTRATTLDRDQTSLAALNIAGLVDLDSGFALAMAAVTIAIFVFGLLLQRRREFLTLRAQGLEPGAIRLLISAEAATVAVGGAIAGVIVGTAMGFYFVTVLRPLFVLSPSYNVPVAALASPVGLVLVATLVSSAVGSRFVNTLQPTELLRDE